MACLVLEHKCKTGNSSDEPQHVSSEQIMKVWWVKEIGAAENPGVC